MKKVVFFCVFFFVFLTSCTYQENTLLPSEIEKAKYSIVKIIIEGSDFRSQGTGFFINQNTIVTNYHVVEFLNSESTTIHFSSFIFQSRVGKEIQFKRIKHLSALYDLAVLEVEGYEGAFLQLGSFLSNDIYTLGFPMGEFCEIKGEDIKQKDIRYFYEASSSSYMDTRGTSGSPILNIQGKVIGVNYFVILFRELESTPAQIRIFFAGTPSDYLSELLHEHELPLVKPEELIRAEMVNLKGLAKSGNAEAQYMLGDSLLRKGKGLSLAFEWNLKAAKQGHLLAMSNIAFMYRYGVGVEPNNKKFYEWFRKSKITDLVQ